MDHLALNVYLREWSDQDRFLVELLGPALRELRDEGLVRRFWFTRFDARGPHLFILLSTPGNRSAEVRERLGTLMDEGLAAYGSTGGPDQDELEKRHAECRGRCLCSIDAEPGFAPRDSYRFAGQPPNAYPFYVLPATADGLWELITDLTFWNLGYLGGSESTAAALRWVATMDRTLTRAGMDTADYWRYHATTLLVPLQERLATSEEAVLAALPGSVGDRNRAIFDRVWAETGSSSGSWPGAERLVGAIRSLDPSPPRWWAMLREIDHCTLIQLGQPTRVHIPLVLYAWMRNLPRSGSLVVARP
ncbi:MAG TPA: lantibiotic dehydratase C-terminal domain-containing protein [Longimicrobiaceae bacterium]|nr:lantibiotic dehydratase C-terminal domain-containing protein [Longimicrobiaceae bacterium]